MLSRSRVESATPLETSYQAKRPRSTGCACTKKGYGLPTPCIACTQPQLLNPEHPDHHRCPGRVNHADGTRLPCPGVLQLRRAATAQLTWLDTPAVLACTSCPTKVAILVTYQHRFSSPPLARFNGQCRNCKRHLIVTDDRPPADAEWKVKGDVRFHEAAYHQVPACPEFEACDLVDVCLQSTGVPPTSVVVPS